MTFTAKGEMGSIRLFQGAGIQFRYGPRQTFSP